MKHIVIGTAGHVDHGKTELVKAMTGIDTDRLKEEKQRGISIELGFAHLKLPSGRTASIVDVPGHEKFIKNMLAGACGIDLVLLVIAADEGVMPQTAEHMDILQLLNVKTGIVTLTKIDMVDSDWLEMVIDEVKSFLKDTTFKEAPIVPVSAVTKEGLDVLLKKIEEVVGKLERKKAFDFLYLPVDRVFSVTGFGTVATGTLLSGEISLGNEIEILPDKILAKVRNIEVHNKKVTKAFQSQRVAVNLSGVEAKDLKRGCVISNPDVIKPTDIIDVKLKLLKSAVKPLKNRTRIRLHIGTSEIMCRVILLDRDELAAGEEAYAQLLLEDKTAAIKGNNFVIRSYSPMRTIGGGVVIDPNPAKHRRFDDNVIKMLKISEKGCIEELVENYIYNRKEIIHLREISKAFFLDINKIFEIAQKIKEQGKIKFIGKDNVLSSELYKEWCELISEILRKYHLSYPLRQGYPKEELRSRFFSFLSTKVFQSLLCEMQKRGILSIDADVVRLTCFSEEPSDEDKEALKNIEQSFKEKPFSPPKWTSVVEELRIDDEKASEYLQYLLNRGCLCKVAEDMYFHTEAVECAKNKIIDFLKQNQKISVGEVRDLLGTSRKYVLPLLEYFDAKHITRRDKDKRVLGSNANI